MDSGPVIRPKKSYYNRGNCLIGKLFFNFFYPYASQGLITALASVAVGTGLLKPNISSLLGNEYKKIQRDERVVLLFSIWVSHLELF